MQLLITRQLAGLSTLTELCVSYLQLLRRVDAGEALDLAGIPDLSLQQRLRHLFRQLHLHCTNKVQHPHLSLKLPV